MPTMFRHIGLLPFTKERATYSITGAAVSWEEPVSKSPRLSAHITIYVYSGVALVSLLGSTTGPFIELVEGQAFDFPVQANAIYVKGKIGNTDVGVVAALNPLERGL